MDWIWDHLVMLAGAAAVAIVLGALVVLVLRAIRAWRSTRTAISLTGERVATVTSAVERAQTRAEGLSERGEELAGARGGLDRQLALAKVLATHLGKALDILKAPLRALGR